SGREVRLQVTLTSTDADTDNVVLRHGFARDGHKRRIKLHLASQTFNGTVYSRGFVGTFHVHFKKGVFAAVVDAMTRGTLFDDAAAVSTSFWSVPYLVTR